MVSFRYPSVTRVKLKHVTLLTDGFNGRACYPSIILPIAGKIEACYAFNGLLLSFHYPYVTLPLSFRYAGQMFARKCLEKQKEPLTCYATIRLFVYLHIYIYIYDMIYTCVCIDHCACVLNHCAGRPWQTAVIFIATVCGPILAAYR
jgi:hypothetical protein